MFFVHYVVIYFVIFNGEQTVSHYISYSEYALIFRRCSFVNALICKGKIIQDEFKSIPMSLNCCDCELTKNDLHLHLSPSPGNLHVPEGSHPQYDDRGGSEEDGRGHC